MVLEQRIMFDGAAVETAAAVLEGVDTALDAVPAATGETATRATEVVFVDELLPQAGVLAAHVGEGAQVITLSPKSDPLQQMRDALSGRYDISAIHILSHGTTGTMTLGGLTITNDNVASLADAFAQIGQSLTSNGDILLYGCDIGSGAAGQLLINRIAEYSQAEVVASTDATGGSQEGGDWVLEASTGAVEARTLQFTDAANPGLLGTPTVSSVDDTTYVEGSGAVIVDSTITVTGGSSYDGQYVRFSVTNGQTTDILTLTNAANVNASGAISFSGSSVYLGNGSGRDIIGTIDNTENGTAGKALKINFVSTFNNSSFESGNLTGWTAMNQVINLGTTSIAGYTSPNDGTYPSNAGNDDPYPSTVGNYSTTVDSAQHTDGSYSLRLLSTSITTASGYDVVHGPAVYSDVFSASAGDNIYFDWRAMYGSDAYDVYGYILNTATGATTKVLDATGTTTSSTNWATVSATIPTTGNYRFVFVSGTYDLSGGRAAGASLYIDNVRVYGSKVTDAVVTSIARQVAFNATSDSPVTATTRVFKVEAMSATNASANDTGLINITATNDAPVLSGSAQTMAYTENGVALPIDTVITVADPDQPSNLNGGWLQAQITTNGATEDQLSIVNQGAGAGQIGVSGSNVTYSGTIIGSIDTTRTGANNTALRINLNSNATTTSVQALARLITYSNTSDTPSTSNRTVTFVLDDGGNTGTGGALQGTRTATVTVASVDDPSVLTLSTASKTYDENDNSYYVDSSLTLTDVDSTSINGARVVISNNFKTSEDRLYPSSGTDISGKINYSFSSTTGILTLSGTATIAEYQAALRAVKYQNLSDNPDTSARSISITIGNAVALTINGTTHYYEYVSGSYTWTAAKAAAEARTFQGLTGYLATITSQTENDFIKEKLQADAWMGASDDYTYINAATGATTYASQSAAEGKWYWVAGPEKGTLISTGNTNPVTASNGYAYWNGSEPNNSGSNEHYGEIYSSGASPGKWNDLPNSSTLPFVVEYSDTNSVSSFSKSIVITPVRKNDAPVNSSPGAIPSISEDAVSNSGSLISSFLNTSDADGNALGIAVTAVDNSHGAWQYSTDGGATWTAFGSPSDSAACLLRSTDKVRFVPGADFAGTATIAYRAWDRTTGTVGSTADLSGANTVGTYKAVTNGDETAYSVAKQTATLTVSAVNDAPVMTPATPALTPITENDTSNAGQTVDSFLGSSISDADASALQGIAITALTSGNGTWQYNTGSGWTSVGTVSASSALLLRGTDSLRFVPDGNNGTTGTLSYKAWDQTSGSAGSKTSTASSGGATAFSTASDTASITVTSVNDAPVQGTPANLSGISEDASNNAGQTIASFLGSSLTDVDTGAQQGIAITAASNGTATGAWEYSTDGGATWYTVGSPSTFAALLLKASDRVRFNADGFKGGTPTLTLRGWDQSTGSATSGATRGEADVSSNGGTTAFSSAGKIVSIAVSDVNDAPSFTTPASASAFTENSGSPSTVGANLVIADDGGTLSKVVVSISSGFTTGDTLAVGTAGGLSVSYNASTGVLTLSGSASAATYQTALRSVTFTSASEDPTINSATRTLTWKATDSSGLVGNASTSTLTVTPLADAPVLGGTAASFAYTEDDSARILSPLLTLSDADDTQMAGAVVLLSGTGLDKAAEYLTLRGASPALNGGAYEWSVNDVMGYTGVNATYVWDSANSRGVLTITGQASTAAYQQILRSVSYTSLGDYTADPDATPVVGTRSVDWQVIDANSDGAGSDDVAAFLGAGSGNGTLSNLVSQTITIANANEAPQVSGADIALSYDEGDTIKILANAIVPSDDDSDNILGSAQVQITAGLTEGDTLAVGDDVDASDGYTHTVTGTTVDLNWNSVTASRTTTGDGSTAEIETLSNLPKFASGQSFTLVADGVTLSGTLAGATLDDLVTALQADSDYGAAPFALARSGADLVITWIANGAVTSPATLTSDSILHETVTASYSNSGILSLSGNASIAAYQSVLRSVTYSNTTNDDPTATANTRAVQWRVFDANGTPSAVDANATTAIQVTAVNDAPVVTPDAGSITFTEDGAAVVASPTLSLSDPDDTLLTGASVEITAGGFTGDLLAIDAGILSAAGLTLDVSSTADHLVFIGTASLATYEAVLRQVTFSSSSENPSNDGTAPTRTLSWTVTDDFASRLTDYPAGNDADATKATSSVITSTVTIAPVNDAPTLASLPGTAAAYTEGDSAVTLASGITVADIDDADLTHARVWISGGFTAGDTLSANVGSTGITVNYDPAAGILTLSHAGANKADFESVLRTVTFSSSSNDPTTIAANRSISWQITDADASTAGADKLDSTVGTSSVDLTATDNAATISGLGGAAFTEKGSPVVVAPSATLADVDDTTLSGLTVTISSGLTSGDLLSVTADLSGSGITITAFNAGTGAMVLSGTASLADYERALQSIVFSSSSNNPTASSTSRTLTWSTTSSFASRLADAPSSNDSAGGTVSSSAGSTTITLTPSNDAPTLSLGHNTVLDSSAVVFEQGGSPIYVLDNGNPNVVGSATLADADDTGMSSATVVISANRATDDSDTLSVVTPTSWSRVGNTLTAPGGGTVTVGFNASTGTLTLTTASGTVSTAEYEALLEYVQYQNSSLSPTASGASRELTWTITDANAAGDGAGSVTGKSYMVIRDRNDAPTILPSTPSASYVEGDTSVALPDVVVTDVDPDEIVIATLTLSNTAAGVLTVPTGALYNATTGVWTVSGSVADVNTALAAVSFTPASDYDQNATISVTVNDGGEDGASAAGGAISLNVTAVNDAPVLTPAAPVLTPMTEDATSDAGVQVSSVRGSISDVDSTSAPGIAITAQDAGNGKWQYQIGGNSGSWTDFSSVSDASALVLADADYIRFVPNGANATTASLTYRAWDGSGTVSAQHMDATAAGGSTPFSTTSDQVSLVVTGVNDAPVLTAVSATLNSMTEDDINNDGQPISDLLGAVSDVDTGAASGIAIFGLDSGNGTWQYRLDGGTTWINVGTVSDSNALLLTNSDHIRFVPNGMNATMADFSFRAWDQSTGSAGSKVDASSTGGTTAFSATSDTASLTVVDAVNDAPVLTPAAPSLDSITEDDTSNAGQTVASILGTSVSDVDLSAQEGIAITGTTNGNGHWQYAIDVGVWIDFPALSESSALLLRATDYVRFVPDTLNGTTATLTYRAWDQSAGTTGSQLDAGTNGGSTPFSTATDTATITVTAVNDAPINDVLPSRTGGERGDGTLRQNGLAFGDPGLWHEVDNGDPDTAITYQWQVADDVSGTGVTDIPGATSQNYVVSPDYVGKYLRLKVMGGDAVSTTAAYSAYTEITNTDPTADGSLISQTATESVPFSFEVPGTTFSDVNPEDALTYSATLSDGSPLPFWLHFDIVTRTFSGTPTGGDIGDIEVRVWFSDGGNNPAHADFGLQVLGIPQKAPENLPVTDTPPPSIPVQETGNGDLPNVGGAPLPLTLPEAAGSPSVGDPAGIPNLFDSILGLGNQLSSALNPERGDRSNATFLNSDGLTRPEGFQVLVRDSGSKNSNELRIGHGLEEQDITALRPFTIQLPSDIFIHTNVNAVIQLTATQIDGTPLPDWLEFNARKGEFKGMAPAESVSEIDVIITARDENGHTATVRFRIRIGDRLSSGKPGLSEQFRNTGWQAHQAERLSMVRHAGEIKHRRSA